MPKGFPFVPFLQVKGYSLQWNQSYRHVEAYPGFRALDGMLAHWPKGPHPNSLPLHQPTLSLVKWYPLLHQGRERRCTRRVFAQEHNTVAKARMSSTWSDQKTIGRSFVLFISAVYFSSKNFPSLGLKAIKFKIKCQTQQALFGTVKVRKSKTTLFGTARTYAFIYTQLRCSLLWLKKNKILEWGRFWFSKTEQTFYVWSYCLWDKFGMHGLSYLAWRSLPFYYTVNCLLLYVCLDSWNSVKENLAGSSAFFSRHSR